MKMEESLRNNHLKSYTPGICSNIEENFIYKSKDNNCYLINLSNKENHIIIKINDTMIPLISFKLSISLDEFYFLDTYFKNFKSISSIYDILKELIKNNLNNINIKNNNSSLELIIPLSNFEQKHISFFLIKSQDSIEQDLKNIINQIKELIFEKEKLNLKISELKEEMKREKEKLKSKILELEKELENAKNNILLISNSKDSLFSNLLKISPFVNNLTILPPNFIIPKLNTLNAKKYKVIIYDMKDYGFGLEDNYSEIKNYLLNGGNIIVTHDHWTLKGYKGKSYELLGAKLNHQENYKHVKKAHILAKNHDIFNSYFSLDKNIFDIAETHKSDTIFPDNNYLKDLLIELNDDKHGEYLMVKNFKKGKLVFWNVGHNPNLTEYEQNLFLNIIAWIYKDS